MKNPLVISAIERHHPPFRFPPPRTVGGRYDRMTILAGIVCKEFIILGADSRWTDSIDGSTVEADKISIVKFGRDDVLVAQAGLRPVSMRIVETMRGKAKDVSITCEHDVTKVLEDSIRETKRFLDKDQMDFCEKFNAALILAFYIDGRPFIYTCMAFSSGIAEPALSHFATAGIADTLANYILKDFAQPRPVDEIQLAALIYTILKVKENNAYCGGPTTVKFLKTFWTGLDSPRVAQARPIAASFIDRFEKKLRMVDESTKAARNRELFAAIRQVSDEFTKENWQSPNA